MIYRGTVTRVAGTKLYVKVPELGGTKEFGPIDSIQAKQPTIVNNTVALVTNGTALTSDSGGEPAHTHTDAAHTHPIVAHNHTVTNTHYNKGDKVIVAQLGAIPENLVVLGRL
jgi:hypothetical protein